MRPLVPLLAGAFLIGGCAPAPGSNADLEARVAALEKEVADLRGRVRSKAEVAEEAVVGKDAVLVAEEWLQGTATLEESKATLFVFWELWCPHCKREVPKLQATWEAHRDQGFNIVGVTRLTRDTKPAELAKWLADNHVGYPIAKDDGTMGEHYAVSGVPAAALVKDGKIVWRGHPANLNDNMVAATLR